MPGHVRKRGNKHVFVLELPRLADGRRRQSWSRGYRTKKEAEAAYTEAAGRLLTNTYIEPSKVTVAAYLREWLDGTRASLRPSTWASYKRNLDTYVLPPLGHLPLQQLTCAQLDSLYADLLSAGGRDGRPLGPSTVRYVHRIVRKALAEGVRGNRLMRNVADLAKPPRANPTGNFKTWNATELRTFLQSAADERLYAALRVAAMTGMRRGEVAGLRWRDCDLEKGQLTVVQALILVENKLTFSEPKTARSRRLVALDEETVAVLRSHRARQLEERLFLGAAYADGDLVFAKEDGTPVRPDHLSDLFQRLAKRAGLPRIKLHELRHSHATIAFASGVHPKVISDRLGHSSVAFTMDVYSASVPALHDEAATTIARAVSGK